MSMSLAERFWAKVSPGAESDCWPWAGAREVAGYGTLFRDRDAAGRSRFLKAHRVSWELANRIAVPDGLSVLHSCDNPPCVNPAHLRVGTRADNAADRAERRRGKEHRQAGEANDNAKLTEADVRHIVAELRSPDHRSQTAIATAFGVKQQQVSRIARRENWRHLWDE